MVFISPRARPGQFLACMCHTPSVMPRCLPTCSPNFNNLDHLVSVMYYAIILTWGGGAQGMECNHLKHTICGQGDCHMFILNSMLLILTMCVKTQHLQGHSRLIVCTLSHSISCLVLFVLAILYLLTFKLVFFVMEPGKA